MNAHKQSKTMFLLTTKFLALALGSFLLWGCSAMPLGGVNKVGLVNAGASPTPAEADASTAPGTSRADARKDMALEIQVKKETARQAYQEALKKKENLQFEEAEVLLDKAVTLDPSFEEAMVELDMIRYQLDKLSGEQAVTTRTFLDSQKLRIQEARAQMERLYAEGRAMMADKHYKSAAEKFKRVVEINNFYPWNLNRPELVELARKSATIAEDLAQKQLVAEKRRLDKEIAEMADYQRAHDLVYIKNRIKELKRRTWEAFRAGEYKKTLILCKHILSIDPNDTEIQSLLVRTRRLNHIITQDQIQRKTARNRDLVIRDIEEAAIPYQDIFRYPPRKEWEKLGSTKLSLEERVQAEEPIENLNIARKLETTKIKSISFENRPLKEVLDYLQTISNISFVANKQAQDSMEMGELTVDLPEVTNLSLLDVLQLVLEQAGSTEPYSYQIKSGAIIIGPSETLKKRMFTEFYPINDIAASRPDFPAPPLSIRLKTQDDSGGLDAGGGVFDTDDGESQKPSVGPEKLVELIQSRIFEEDEENGSVEHQSGRLVVNTTLPNHAKIKELLEQLRKLSGIQVSVEARFLDIQDNLLEEIGVDIGGPVESALSYPIPDVNGLGTSVASGYAFIDRGLAYETRSTVISDYSGFLGTEVTPFNIGNEGGMALQWNLIENYQLEAIMTTVAKTQKTHTLDAPRVLAFDNQIAHTMVINQIAYIKDVDVNQTGVSPVINPLIGSFRVGSMLEIRPTVTHDRKYVILEVKPTSARHVDSKYAQLSLAQGYTMVEVELPVILLSQIKTTITIPDGGTVLVGGLKKIIEQERSIGIPVLQRIPVLNLLFGRRGQTRLRNNQFVLIKANILSIKEEEKINFP